MSCAAFPSLRQHYYPQPSLFRTDAMALPRGVKGGGWMLKRYRVLNCYSRNVQGLLGCVILYKHTYKWDWVGGGAIRRWTHRFPYTVTHTRQINKQSQRWLLSSYVSEVGIRSWEGRYKVGKQDVSANDVLSVVSGSVVFHTWRI